jgi:hypothetical protein
MKKRVLSALSLMLTVGCSKSEPPPEPPPLSQAVAAIEALSELDGQAVARCEQAVDACNQRLPETAAVKVCQRLADRCDALAARLTEARGPAVACWNALRACEEHAPEQAQCSRDASLCEALAEEDAQERDRAVRCEDRVQACLTRAEELPEAALKACDNIAASCERAAGGKDKADAGVKDDDDDQDDDDQDDDDQDDDDQDDDDQDDDDQDDDDQDDDDDDQGEDAGKPARPDRPKDSPGRGPRDRADAGVEIDD